MELASVRPFYHTNASIYIFLECNEQFSAITPQAISMVQISPDRKKTSVGEIPYLGRQGCYHYKSEQVGLLVFHNELRSEA